MLSVRRRGEASSAEIDDLLEGMYTKVKRTCAPKNRVLSCRLRQLFFRSSHRRTWAHLSNIDSGGIVSLSRSWVNMG